ncbi:MAG: hypothetical protein Ct9H300mP12_08660 [Acidimicrobiales bacterium]|nr:MAG: hypothetical protein Ct9H300mP12_08660 [Acidimicrobiales bacterium]
MVIDRAGVREHLNSVTDYSGIIGLITCDAFGDCGSQKITVIGHADSGDIAASNANVVYEYAPGGSSFGEGNLVVPAAKPQYGGTVVIGLEAEAVGLGRGRSVRIVVLHDAGPDFDPLLPQAKTGEYLPWLAESIVPNDDFPVWTVTLRSGGPSTTARRSLPRRSGHFPVPAGWFFGRRRDRYRRSGKRRSPRGTSPVDYTLGATNVAFPSFLKGAPIGYPFDPEAAAVSRCLQRQSCRDRPVRSGQPRHRQRDGPGS